MVMDGVMDGVMNGEEKKKKRIGTNQLASVRSSPRAIPTKSAGYSAITAPPPHPKKGDLRTLRLAASRGPGGSFLG